MLPKISSNVSVFPTEPDGDPLTDWLTSLARIKTKIPDELVASWMAPGLSDPGVKRDAKKVTAGMNKRHTLEAVGKLGSSDLPVLLTWAPGDRLFPISYAERFAKEVPNARLVEIPEAGTFVPLDQPRRIADEIAEFVGSS